MNAAIVNGQFDEFSYFGNLITFHLFQVTFEIWVIINDKNRSPSLSLFLSPVLQPRRVRNANNEAVSVMAPRNPLSSGEI